ncbi:hypothetical protein [Faecalispora anaeroviscerum]|uniref:hypothetical protein n=1 Tax=Faecalispora anaeroviscerum TaxID=2991836 RepID=UPI0024BA4073|nr:hypothetical protein [Faecalispora anaeroviscerum]
MITVSIISPKVSMKAINHVIDHQDFGCIFLKYTYDRQEDIFDIYRQCKDKCDVICFSGEMGLHFMRNNIPNSVVPYTFVYYNEIHVLSILLNFLAEHPTIPLNRIYVDFLTPINEYMNLPHYLPPEHMPYCHNSADYTYETILQRPVELYQQGKIDFLITRCTNNLEAIRKAGIPFQHILPTEEMIADAIRGALDKLRLSLAGSQRQMTILIQPVFAENASNTEMEYDRVTLYKALVDFRHENHFDFRISLGEYRFELTPQTISEKQRTLLSKELVSYLANRTSLKFRVGVGIGATMDSARYCAETALHEAVTFGKNDGFLMDDSEDSMLTGPLSSPTTLSYSYSNYKAQQYSSQNNIDERNLLRIIGLFEMDNESIITSKSLADWLNITVRSCNRILSQLLDSGLIEELPVLKSNERGRPIRQYRFHIENCLKTFR